MSGGSFDYMYNGIKDMYEGHMKDKVMDKLIKDLVWFCMTLSGGRVVIHQRPTTEKASNGSRISG